MNKPAEVLCIGGAVLDRKFRLGAPLLPGTSNPASSSRTFGGVARNVCENLARLGLATALATRVGADEAGAAISRQLAELGVDISRVQTDFSLPTAEYLAILGPDGSLQAGLADMAIFDRIDLDWLGPGNLPGWIFADCNLPAETLAELASTAQLGGAKLAVDCVSVAKAARPAACLKGIDLLFANRDEAEALLQHSLPPGQLAEMLRAKGAKAVIVTLGAEGLMLADAHGTRHLPAPATPVVDVTGAGDALVAATLAALARGADLPAAAQRGIEAAQLTLGSSASVRTDLTMALAALRSGK